MNVSLSYFFILCIHVPVYTSCTHVQSYEKMNPVIINYLHKDGMYIHEKRCPCLCNFLLDIICMCVLLLLHQYYKFVDYFFFPFFFFFSSPIESTAACAMSNSVIRSRIVTSNSTHDPRSV